jgi:oxygen-independent coproporphyrinogen III oxidase
MNEISLYAHIPFCLRKCAYCDFASSADSGIDHRDYVSAILREMELRSEDVPEDSTAVTLYFGGGTPSLLSPGEIGRIVDAASRLYGLAADAEVTLEANPGTVDREKLSGYRSAGVNRLSLGVQSLDDAMLRFLGRVHTAADAVAAVAAARAAGFDNLGIDLIHTLPGETAAEWERELRRGMELAPEHVSAYALTVEEGTPLGRLRDEGRLRLPDEETAGEIFSLTGSFLASSGYEHYEVSNFARAGRRSRHNSGYWLRRDSLAFGAAAHSFRRRPGWGRRWHNPLAAAEYMRVIGAGFLPEEELQVLTRREAVAEALFLGLRMAEGVDERAFREEFGESLDALFGDELGRLERGGLVVRSEGRLRLTESGLLLSNQVFSLFV